MYKASIELGRINKTLKIKFGIIIQSEEELKQSSYNKLINKFDYMGNTYLRINPRPFVTLDISKGADKNDGWSTNQSVNLNKQKLYEFVNKFKVFINKFKEIKELFYFDDEDTLKLNTEVSKTINIDIISSNKHIRIEPCVVPSDESEEIFYEGCLLCINTYDNFSYITFDEMNYLEYELAKIDMIQLSIEMLKLANMYKNDESEDIKKENKTVSKKEEETLDKPFVIKHQENSIPDI